MFVLFKRFCNIYSRVVVSRQAVLLDVKAMMIFFVLDEKGNIEM